MTTTIPTGFRANSKGHLVPEAEIKDIDKLRDDTVQAIIRHASGVQLQLQAFKTQAFADIATFMQLSAEQYGVKWGGEKGNVSLISYDGKYKVLLAVADRLAFGEQLHIAKQLIDECIHAWTDGSSSKIQALIEHAFQTDKQGKINTARVLSLLSLKMDGDEKWATAMNALKDSIQTVSSSKYIRLYERVGKSDEYRQISLDLASLIINESDEKEAA